MKALKMDRLNSQKQKADDDASQKPEKKPEGPSFEDIVGMLDRLKSEKQMKPTSSKVQFLPSFFWMYKTGAIYDWNVKSGLEIRPRFWICRALELFAWVFRKI